MAPLDVITTATAFTELRQQGVKVAKPYTLNLNPEP